MHHLILSHSNSSINPMRRRHITIHDTTPHSSIFAFHKYFKFLFPISISRDVYQLWRILNNHIFMFQFTHSIHAAKGIKWILVNLIQNPSQTSQYFKLQTLNNL
ncbi:hypothetical protein HanPI659440_Chr14g0545041 [Helianthus annuus]|nr:hypothetical protein HanPI659440_Chr14g0545041 [Helianthus annuus]